jgi:hypothetical protein
LTSHFSEETFKFTLSPDEYLGKLKEQYMMLITTTAHIKETDKTVGQLNQIINQSTRNPQNTILVPAKCIELGIIL